MALNTVIIVGDIDITALIKAQATLEEALAVKQTSLTRDGCIQRFEYCFELSWKMIRRVLAYKGITVNSPRDTFREAARIPILDEPLLWFDFLKKRNDTVHTYNEAVAKEIFAILPTFNTHLKVLIKTLRKLP